MNVKLQDYMKDYRLMKINAKDIFTAMGISRTTLYKMMKEQDYVSNQKIYEGLNTGIYNLDYMLKNKYSGIVRRCNGRKSYKYAYNYEGLEYLPINEWVDFCMNNKDDLINMYQRYIASGEDLRLAVSIDRIDNSKGYFVDNMQFITHGLNGFKRNVNPVRVTYNNETRYFMTAKEASRYYGIRQNTFGDMLRGIDRIVGQDYEVEHSDIGTVLNKNNIKSLNYYYEIHYIKEWYNGLF